MEGGFFNRSILAAVKPSLPMVPLCGICGLWQHCQSPKMPVSGKGKRKIFLLGEGAGLNEDREGVQFFGASGKLLEGFLRRVGINMREDCWLDNSTKCRATDEFGENRKPTDTEINACRPALIRNLVELKPEVVIPLGKVALQSLMRIVWKGESVDTINRWVGWKIPEQTFNMWICPNWHPAYLLYENKRTEKGNPVLEMYFERYLRQAADLRGRPWNNNIPKLEVERIRSPRIAVQEIKGFIERGKVTAFDYETTSLKPQAECAEIYCASLADQDHCIAFPWSEPVQEAMIEFLKSRVWKVGWNNVFESVWTMTKLGCRVRNFFFDGMLSTHILDNRSQICSLKYQAFIQLGIADYDSHIKPYLKADGSNRPNRIKELDLDEVLNYCGIDSRIEYTLAKSMMKQLGIPDPDEGEE